MRQWFFVQSIFLLIVLLFPLGCSCNGFPIPELPTKIIGLCVYENQFSKKDECKEYLGDWNVEDAKEDCESNDSKIQLGKQCEFKAEEKFGDCIYIIDKEKELYSRVIFPGKDKDVCSSVERGCEFFSGGSFLPSVVCGGLPEQTFDALAVYRPAEYLCKDPREGEEPGKGADGKVCTWVSMAGATEEGRKFEDYASCDWVRTQRPYYPLPAADSKDDPDARMSDPEYLSENNWVKSQVLATSCVCCHSTLTPKGPSKWYLESEPNWMNSFSDRGLAIGAGWISMLSSGAYPSEQNNGFSRPTPDDPNHSGFTTNDDERMRRFFESELAYRGKTREDFKEFTHIGGPQTDHFFYEPKPCGDKQRIDQDGTIHWLGGPARYLYILKEGSRSPVVPPNLFRPEGTLWRIDIAWQQDELLESGQVRYGDLPFEGITQAIPENGTPESLVVGQRYYLYVLKDVGLPITRCLFQAK